MNKSKKRKNMVLFIGFFITALIIIAIAMETYNFAVNSLLPYSDLLMVFSATVGCFGVMFEGAMLYIIGYQNGLSKAQMSNIEVKQQESTE